MLRHQRRAAACCFDSVGVQNAKIAAFMLPSSLSRANRNLGFWEAPPALQAATIGRERSSGRNRLAVNVHLIIAALDPKTDHPGMILCVGRIFTITCGL